MYKIIWKYIIDNIEHEEEFDDPYLLYLRFTILLYTLGQDGRSFIISVEYTAKIEYGR